MLESIKNKKITVAGILYITVLASFVFPIFRITSGFITAFANNKAQTNFSDDLLTLLQCLLGVTAIQLPLILKTRFKLELPSILDTAYTVFLYCSVYLGEVRDLYVTVPYWDSILHAFSSIMTGAFAFILTAIPICGKTSKDKSSPLFIALFALTFSISIGTLWEIYEFTLDSLFGLNMQKYRMDDGTRLIGSQALSDTMNDLILDTLGATFTSFIGYFALKNKSSHLNSYLEKLSEATKEQTKMRSK